ncbi:lipoprotein [Mycoplasma mycoides]|uniref:lipoprotein n=1 Tax=Mycoplasma mycoides TaxID=2102 RepID=UPI00273641F3|nr:lipoprotein [Mycoplasma mycoides]MDP4040163.1 lipoprotein [Mycoplasma mycoides]MDP4041030.1 lipoprotein [Mycoplasma mycoides]MDP4042025.1 lipoprotein [Mycoplasma mycoides]MDP4043902.1 lipoprotein [Mycoplasma mycoides]MDP4044802.1 lipoprotein [Mycoplasma mycoides]
MKKLLTILGSVGLIATTSATVVACGDKSPQNSNNKIIESMNDKSNDNLKVQKNNNEKISNTKESRKEKMNKELKKTTQLEKKEDAKKIQDEEAKPEKYILKRSKEENLSFTKEYGLKHTNFIFDKRDEWEKWKSDTKNSSLSSLAGKLTSFYSEISQYSSVTELQAQFDIKFNKKKKYKSFDEFIEQIDKVVTDYQKEKDTIWNQLKSIQSK